MRWGAAALGFTSELYDDSGELDADAMAMLEQMGGVYPHLTEMVAGIVHDEDTTLRMVRRPGRIRVRARSLTGRTGDAAGPSSCLFWPAALNAQIL